MPDTSGNAVRPQETTVDILVLGGGAAGLAAALFAAIHGARVVVCEKSTVVGGTAATSAGSLWVPGSSQAANRGLPGSRDDAARYLDSETRGLGGGELRRAYLEAAPIAIDCLEQNSDVRFEPVSQHPDYHDGPGSTAGGRPLVPVEFDGRLLGEDFDRLRSPLPEFLLFGGMMISRVDVDHLLNAFKTWRSFKYTARLLLRYALDRLGYRRGTRLIMGNALVARLLFSLRQRRVEIWFGAVAIELLSDQQSVVGAVVKRNGKDIIVRTRRAVILASGGFANSTELRSELLPADMAPQRSLTCPTAEGDGLRLARSVGGAVEADHDSPLFQMPISVFRRPDGSESRYPHIFLDRTKPGIIAVNGLGKRFVNEAVSYHDFGLAMYRSHNAVPCYLICGARFIRTYGLGLIHPGGQSLRRYLKDGYLVEGHSIDDLAGKVGIDGAALTQSVDAFNVDAERGIDREFGKGTTVLNRFNGDPGHGPNPCVGPVEGPPFYALAIWPADIGTSMGIKTDVDGSVIAEDGHAIPGLYACGSDMSSVMRGTYPGPGITLGPAVTFAYRAVRHALDMPHVVGHND